MSGTPAKHAPRATLARIRSLEGSKSFRPSEAAVARLVLAAPNAAVRLPVEDLAARAKVSTASVLRFCQALGFKGFKEFKITLAGELGGGPAVLPAAIELTDTPVQIARKVLQAEVQALHDSLELLDRAALEQAVDVLAEAQRIELFGMGSSTPVVTDAYYRFRRIGLQVSTAPDSHMQPVNAALLEAVDAALFISHTGHTREILTAARIARDTGCPVIVLTSFLESPLLSFADVKLVTAVMETEFRVEAMASRLAHLFVIDVLYVALAVRSEQLSTSALDRTRSAIERQRLDFGGEG